MGDSAGFGVCRLPECERLARSSWGFCDVHGSRQGREQLKARACELRAQGASTAEIAALFGVGQYTAARWVSGVQVPEVEPEHGTMRAYGQGCRCTECVQAMREYKKAQYRRRVSAPSVSAEHGTMRAYGQGCRCTECKAAMAAVSAQRRQQSQTKAVRKRARWTDQELRTAFDESIPLEKRAQMLGRSYSAVDSVLRRRKNPEAD